MLTNKEWNVLTAIHKLNEKLHIVTHVQEEEETLTHSITPIIIN